MLIRSFPAFDNILHFILGAAILVCQLLIVFDSGFQDPYNAAKVHANGTEVGSYSDHIVGKENTLDFGSLLAIVSVVLVLILHLTQALRSGREETDMSKVSRNLLVAIALAGQFMAIGLFNQADNKPSMTLPILVLAGLSLMRVMDSLMDFTDPKEALAVQCIEDRFGARVLTIHVLLGAAAALESYKYSQYQALSDIDSKMGSSEQSLDLVVMILLWVHFAIYPLNALIRISGLDRWAKMCMPCRCFENQYVENCDEQDRSKLDPDQLELVAITRLPILRHVIAGTIIASLGYIVGSVFHKLDLTYQIPALLFYLAADVVGRNYL